MLCLPLVSDTLTITMSKKQWLKLYDELHNNHGNKYGEHLFGFYKYLWRYFNNVTLTEAGRKAIEDG